MKTAFEQIDLLPSNKKIKLNDDFIVIHPPGFGTLDYQKDNFEISVCYKELPPSSEDWMRVPRYDKKLIGEYFGYQFLIAMDCPAPETRIVVYNHSIYLESKFIKETFFGEIDKTIQTTTTQDKQYRLDKSYFINPFAELVIQDKDSCQSLSAEYQNRLYRVAKDREAVSPTLLVDESQVWNSLFKFDRLDLFGEITLEQQFACVYQLEKIIKHNILEKIFYNPKVNATPPLCSSYRDTLYKAWQHNVEMIIKAYKNKYPSLQEEFLKRENIRQQLAEIIINKINFPEGVNQSLFKTELMDDMRHGRYFTEPSLLDEAVLTNQSKILEIINGEQSRACSIYLQPKLDALINAEILHDKKHLYPFPKTLTITQFYRKLVNIFTGFQPIKFKEMSDLLKDVASILKHQNTKQLLAQNSLSGVNFYSLVPLNGLPLTAKQKLILTESKRKGEKLIAKFEEKITYPPTHHHALTPSYLRKEIHYNKINRYQRHLNRQIDEAAKAIGFKQEEIDSCQTNIAEYKSYLKNYLNVYKKEALESIAQTKCHDDHYCLKWLEYIMPKKEYKFCISDRINPQIFVIHFSSLIGHLHLIGSCKKDYFNQIFEHYANLGQTTIPTIEFKINSILITFNTIEQKEKIFKQIILDNDKIYPDVNNPLRKKGYIYSALKAFEENITKNKNLVKP